MLVEVEIVLEEAVGEDDEGMVVMAEFGEDEDGVGVGWDGL